MADSQPIDDDGYPELLEIHRKLDAIMWHIGIRADKEQRIRREIQAAKRAAEQERHEQEGHGERSRRESDEIWERRELVWGRMPRERRESVLLQVLGPDEGLTLGELASRLKAELGVPIFVSDMRYPVKLMLGAGQLERDAERFRNKLRYRYFRKRGLEGPIVDLERAYHHDDGGES